MLFRYELIDGQSTEALIENTQKQSKSLFHKVLHGYLFFKYPLLKPEPWIGHLANRPSFAQSFFVLVDRFAGYISLIEAISQWDRFVTTFSEFASWQGVLLYVVVLTWSKWYTSLRMRLKLSGTGVMWPVWELVFGVISHPVYRFYGCLAFGTSP